MSDTHFIDVYDYTPGNRGAGGSTSNVRSYRANVNFNAGSFNATGSGELEKVDAEIVIMLNANVNVGDSIDIDSTFYEVTKTEKPKGSIGGPISHTEVKVKIDQRGTV